MIRKKILYGICGIGNGHTFRQLPIVKYLADQGNEILIFGYDASLKFFSDFSKNYKNISIQRVEVPYYQGNPKGLDFAASNQITANQKDFFRVNCEAMAQADRTLGKPDLVMSDYEPVSAQYAYACSSPLVTIDQQSKYLVGNFPSLLNGQGYSDEVMRLNMFFPRVDRRFACSFFQVISSEDQAKNSMVDIVPPVLRNEVIHLKRSPTQGKPVLLVYLTAQQGLSQPLEDIVHSLESVQTAEFHIFLPKRVQIFPKASGSLFFHYHGDSIFEGILAKCNGIVSTAGHTLLSEAMYLGIPVYAIPLDLYEQQMNAAIIGHHQFGMVNSHISREGLEQFIGHLETFSYNIAQDRSVLLRSPGQETIIRSLMEQYLATDAS
jgi:uncharacterized protein (TIGR00661 family)